MNCGKVPGNVLKRSVINIIGNGPRTGMDSAVYLPEHKGYVLSSTQTGAYNSPLAPFLAVVKACNNIWASQGLVMGVSAAFLLSDKTKERELKNLTRQTLAACSMCNTGLLGGHTEVTTGVSHPISTVTAVGSALACPRNVRDIRPGMEIIMTKWAGLEEAAILLNDDGIRTRLEERFSPYYMSCFEDYTLWLSVEAEAMAVAGLDDVVMHDNSDGGVFGSLWDMAEGSGLGFEVDLRAIPLRQESVELAYLSDSNVYRMKSSGSLMIACSNGKEVIRLLEEQQIPCACIGKFTDNNDKIIRNEDEIRYLERV